MGTYGKLLFRGSRAPTGIPGPSSEAAIASRLKVKASHVLILNGRPEGQASNLNTHIEEPAETFSGTDWHEASLHSPFAWLQSTPVSRKGAFTVIWGLDF